MQTSHKTARLTPLLVSGVIWQVAAQCCRSTGLGSHKRSQAWAATDSAAIAAVFIGEPE